VAVEGPDVDKLRTIAQEVVGLMRGASFWLEGFLGFKPRVVMFTVNDGLIAEKFRRLAWEECGPWPVFASCTLVFALQRKTLSQGSRKAPFGNDSMCQHGRLVGSHDSARQSGKQAYLANW
jgi:hypothetical protein